MDTASPAINGPRAIRPAPAVQTSASSTALARPLAGEPGRQVARYPRRNLRRWQARRSNGPTVDEVGSPGDDRILRQRPRIA